MSDDKFAKLSADERNDLLTRRLVEDGYLDAIEVSAQQLAMAVSSLTIGIWELQLARQIRADGYRDEPIPATPQELDSDVSIRLAKVRSAAAKIKQLARTPVANWLDKANGTPQGRWARELCSRVDETVRLLTVYASPAFDCLDATDREERIKALEDYFSSVSSQLADLRTDLESSGHREPADNADGPEQTKGGKPADNVDGPEQSDGGKPADSLSRLLRVFTNGVADEKVRHAQFILADDARSVNDKLTEIDALMPFPATASAQKLADLLRVSKKAVQKTDWYKQNRAGKRDQSIERRHRIHQERKDLSDYKRR